MLWLLALALLEQVPTTTISDPSVQSEKVTTTKHGTRRALDVIIVDGGVSILGPVTIAGGPISVNILDAGPPINVQGPLTDTQLRATPVPVSGTVTVGTFPDNEPLNVAQMNGVAVTMGNGASGTGVQRVTIASDSTGTVAATQSGTWTVQQGTAPWQVTSQKRAAAALAQSVSCATSATALPGSPLASRVSVCVTNVGASTVYVGHATVTTATGTPLAAQSGSTPGGSYCDDLGSQPLFCIVASGTVEVRLLEN